ncbi:MAG: hypothetical protein ACRCWR_08240, partial [Saezia sp.]
KGRRFNSQQDVDNNIGLSMTPQWYLNHSQYEPQPGNNFTPYICGEDVFSDIANSIRGAKKSIDIVSWGFDPAMLLDRSDPIYSQIDDGQGHRLPYSAWQEKDSYGGLLLDALERNENLEVRILIWYYFGNAFRDQEQNMVGVGHDSWLRGVEIERTELDTGFSPAAFDSVNGLNNLHLRQRPPSAQVYSMDWFHKVLWGKFKGDGRIAFAFRDLGDFLGTRNTDEEDDLLDRWTTSGETKSLSFPTDHQKTVLIDFEDHANRHVYVMGHNSKTEYWSDRKFTHRDPKREMDHRPFHDFSIKVEGPLTVDVNRNFCEAWCGSIRLLDGLLAPKRPGDPTLAPRESATFFHPTVSIFHEDRNKMREQREALYDEILAKTVGKAKGQIVRTRPDNNPLFGYKEKEIKEAYLQAVRFSRNYILIINQYCQYAKLVRHMKHWRFEYIERIKHHASEGKKVSAGTL